MYFIHVDNEKSQPRRKHSLPVALAVCLLVLTAWSTPAPTEPETVQKSTSQSQQHRKWARHSLGCRSNNVCEGRVEVNDTTVAYVETGKVPANPNCWSRYGRNCTRQTNGKTILFLHGRAFSKQDWVDSNILTRASRPRNRAIAIDLPGYGQTPPTTVGNGQFLADTIQALDLDPQSLVIVSPSLSGFHSLALLDLKPTLPLAGYVAISPRGVPTFGGLTAEETIPTSIMWADQDPALPIKEAELLASKIPDSQVKIFESNVHPFYFDLVPEFNRELRRFVQRLD